MIQESTLHHGSGLRGLPPEPNWQHFIVEPVAKLNLMERRPHAQPGNEEKFPLTSPQRLLPKAPPPEASGEHPQDQGQDQGEAGGGGGS
jgi:hypothetical protein